MRYQQSFLSDYLPLKFKWRYFLLSLKAFWRWWHRFLKHRLLIFDHNLNGLWYELYYRLLDSRLHPSPHCILPAPLLHGLDILKVRREQHAHLADLLLILDVVWVLLLPVLVLASLRIQVSLVHILVIATITTSSCGHDGVRLRGGRLLREILAELAHDVFETPQGLVSLLAVGCLVLVYEVLIIVINFEASSKIALREHKISICVSHSTIIVAEYFLILNPQLLCGLQEYFRAFQIFKTSKFGNKESTIGFQ